MKYLMVLGVLLSGCSMCSKDLECPMPKGMPCSSLDKVSLALDKEDDLLEGRSKAHPEIYVVESWALPLMDDVDRLL
ncbi:MAG: hypothetical protein ACK5YY_00460 [Alphaproteobacteria bacterium]|jgi:hypothetical protein